MRFLVFQHLPVEHPGSFRPLWAANGIGYDSVELEAGEAIPSFDGYDALIVMGGPQDVWQTDLHPWLAPEIEAIRHWVTVLRRPYLGICLGHQLLAKAIGGDVALGAVSEVGFGTVSLTEAGRADPLFRGIPPEKEVFQWHSAEVTRLPANTEVLASNEACAVQAFRYGDHAYGLQYHVELTSDTVPEWSGVPDYERSLKEIFGPDGLSALRRQVGPRLPAFESTARKLAGNFDRIIELTQTTA